MSHGKKQKTHPEATQTGAQHDSADQGSNTTLRCSKGEVLMTYPTP